MHTVKPFRYLHAVAQHRYNTIFCMCPESACVLAAQDWEEGDGDYLAPELLHDAKPTPAADIYSLGATLFETATGDLRSMLASSCLDVFACMLQIPAL